MVARPQAASTRGKPTLPRYDQLAGHGRGKPLDEIVAEWADIWSFIFAQL